jgi:hypothetical protein
LQHQVSGDRLNLLAGVILFCALPLIVMLIAWIAARSSWMIAIGGLVVLSATAATGSIWAARPVTGMVIGKSENLEIASRGLNPGITRRLVLIVVEDRAIDPGQRSPRRAAATTGNPRLAALMQSGDSLQCEVDERLFDSVREGDRIPLHVATWGPLSFARPDAEPWWNWAPGRLERLLPRWWGAGPSVTTEAQIDSARTVRDADVFAWGATSANRLVHFPLAQPYDEVRLRFVTSRGAQILALDRIDAGSAGVLAPRSGMAISYPLDRPRTARLSNGSRSYAWRNVRSYWGDMALVAAVGILLLALAEAARRWVGRRLEARRQAMRGRF